jgi:hypothetical protein
MNAGDQANIAVRHAIILVGKAHVLGLSDWIPSCIPITRPKQSLLDPRISSSKGKPVFGMVET